MIEENSFHNNAEGLNDNRIINKGSILDNYNFDDVNRLH